MADKQWKRLGDGSLITEDADEGLGHIVPKRVYLNVFIALLFLTALTVFVATIDLGELNNVIKMLIATLKASLVVMFFMHVKWEKKLIWFVVLYPGIILALLFMGSYLDFLIKVNPKPQVVSPALEATL